MKLLQSMQFTQVLEARLGSAEAADETANRVLSGDDAGLEALIREDLLTEGELQVAELCSCGFLVPITRDARNVSNVVLCTR